MEFVKRSAHRNQPTQQMVIKLLAKGGGGLLMPHARLELGRARRAAMPASTVGKPPDQIDQ